MLPTFVRPATLEDVEFVAANLREADRQEILAAVGIEPALALPVYINEGREVYASGLQLDNRAEALFGYDPIFGMDRAAVAWLISTDRIYAHPVEFVVQSQKSLDEAHQRFDLLTNFIDARNTRHIRWLQRLGFHMIRKVDKYGYAGIPFIEFVSYRPCA